MRAANTSEPTGPTIVKLIYQTFLPTQGRFPRVSGQVRVLMEAGYDVTVLACDRDATHPESEVLHGVPVRRIAVETAEMRGPFLQAIPLLKFYFRAFRRLRRYPAEMVHCHNLDVLPLGWLLKLATGCKLVFESHEPNYYALWPRPLAPLVWLLERLEMVLARRTDAVSVTNRYQLDKYRAAGCRNVELIGNYPPPELRVGRLDPDKLAGDRLILGRFGTFYPDVGLEATVAAVRRTLDRGVPVQLVLGGRVVDSYRATFDRLIRPLGRHCQYVGEYPADEMRTLYERIHVSCLPYPRNEWFRHITPRKFFDSISNATPVIISDIGGLGRVVRQYECGIVVDPDKIGTIVDAVTALGTDRTLLHSMARNALSLGQTEYSWEAMRSEYLGLMKRVLRV